MLRNHSVSKAGLAGALALMAAAAVSGPVAGQEIVGAAGQSAFGTATPLDASALEQSRGRAAPPCSENCATSMGNSSGATSGSNTIAGSSFSDATGTFVVIQNVGNNVAIVAEMNVTITEAPLP